MWDKKRKDLLVQFFKEPLSRGCTPTTPKLTASPDNGVVGVYPYPTIDVVQIG